MNTEAYNPISTTGADLISFYDSEFWPEEYGLADFEIHAGGEVLDDAWDPEHVGLFIHQLKDDDPVTIASGVFDYDRDDAVKPSLSIHDQFNNWQATKESA